MDGVWSLIKWQFNFLTMNELLNDNDSSNLTHLICSMANKFRFKIAWTENISGILSTNATGVALHT